MQKNVNYQLFTIVSVAFLIALDVIFTRFLSIQTQFLRIGFGFIPVAIAGIAFGPMWGGLCGGIGDILGMLIFPSGVFFPGFTLTAVLTGVVFGFVLHRNVTLLRCLVASAIVCILLNLILDTLWLDIMYGSGYLALLPMRAVKCGINIPVYTILIDLLWNKVLFKVPQLSGHII